MQGFECIKVVAQSEVTGGLIRECGMSDGVTSRDFVEEAALELRGVEGWLRL